MSFLFISFFLKQFHYLQICLFLCLECYSGCKVTILDTLNIEKIDYLGKHVHVHKDKSEVDVHLYKVKINSENELESKEDFLEIIPIHLILERITTINAYTSLCAIVEILKLKECV